MGFLVACKNEEDPIKNEGARVVPTLFIDFSDAQGQITPKSAIEYCRNSSSALDKLLGQMGIYATWISSIAYLQKQLRIFIFFYATFLFCDYTFSNCLKPSGMCLHIYSLPSSAFLKYQTSRFYCTWSKSHPRVDIPACTLCKVSLSS